MTAGVFVGHGRTVVVGQVWQSSDPRRLRGVRIISFIDHTDLVVAENIVTGKRTAISLDAFTVGPRGWHLLKDTRTW